MSQKKLDVVIECHVLGDNTKKGATVQKIYATPTKNSTTKATQSQGRNSTLKSNTHNDTMYRQELLIALRGTVGVPNNSQKEKEGVLLKLEASVRPI